MPVRRGFAAKARQSCQHFTYRAVGRLDAATRIVARSTKLLPTAFLLIPGVCEAVKSLCKQLGQGAVNSAWPAQLEYVTSRIKLGYALRTASSAIGSIDYLSSMFVKLDAHNYFPKFNDGKLTIEKGSAPSNDQLKGSASPRALAPRAPTR
ncbi:MAG: hypothetical protein Q8N33_09210 [Rhodocyclaceae bacterium]|nr:hypothetical protein [Rhodocyclaceae bacterium]